MIGVKNIEEMDSNVDEVKVGFLLIKFSIMYR